MTLNFPYPATIGEVYVGDNGVTYTYDGVKWVAAGGGGALVPVASLSHGNANLILNTDGSVHFPNYLFPSADGIAGQVLTTHGNGIVYWSSISNISNISLLSNGPYTFTLNSDGTVSLPDSTRLNSGGIGVHNSAEFGTVVNKDGGGYIVGSEIYMGSGTAEFRSITQSDGKSLTYTGVENPGFAGMVAMDDGVTSQYAVYADGRGFINIGGTSQGYTAALGVATDTGINGILSNSNLTTVAGGMESISRITIDDSAVTIRITSQDSVDQNWTFSKDSSLTVPGPIQTTALGVPEFRSDTDINLIAGNRVNIKTSPLNLAQFADSQLAGLAGKFGDLIYNRDTRNIQTFIDGDWRRLISTTFNDDVKLTGIGTFRRADGTGVIYTDQVPRDIKDLTDNSHLLQQQSSTDINVDGGGAYVMYTTSLVHADGGFSSSRFGRASTVYDGAGAGDNIYNNFLNGGGA